MYVITSTCIFRRFHFLILEPKADFQSITCVRCSVCSEQIPYLSLFLQVATCHIPGRVAQLVMCQTAYPGVMSSIPAWSHTFAEIDYEIISTAILLTSTDSRMGCC